MIDKLEVRVPAKRLFTYDFSRLYSNAFTDPAYNPFKPARHYATVGDLRPFGYDAILHSYCKHGRDGNHKLELLDTGIKSYQEILDEIQSVFSGDPGDLGVMRVDLAVDIEGISIPWFQEHTHVQYKRWLAKLGVVPMAEMGKNEIQTLYFGKRPNLIRIYDKKAEYNAQFRNLTRIEAPNFVPPTFEELYGVTEECVLTRVERQIGGGRVPSELTTVGDLAHCSDFNPFEALSFVSGGHPEPRPQDYSFSTYCAGMYLRNMAMQQGMQATKKFIRRFSNRNNQWVNNKFGDFFPPTTKGELTGERLFELYQQSLEKQLAGRNSLAKP